MSQILCRHEFAAIWQALHESRVSSLDITSPLALPLSVSLSLSLSLSEPRDASWREVQQDGSAPNPLQSPARSNAMATPGAAMPSGILWSGLRPCSSRVSIRLTLSQKCGSPVVRLPPIESAGGGSTSQACGSALPGSACKPLCL